MGDVEDGVSFDDVIDRGLRESDSEVLERRGPRIMGYLVRYGWGLVMRLNTGD